MILIEEFDLYWVPGGDGNWSNSSNWSFTSGGPGNAGIPDSTTLRPGGFGVVGKNVIFDINSFENSGDSVEIETGSCLGIWICEEVLPFTLNINTSLTYKNEFIIDTENSLTTNGRIISGNGAYWHGNGLGNTIDELYCMPASRILDDNAIDTIIFDVNGGSNSVFIIGAYLQTELHVRVFNVINSSVDNHAVITNSVGVSWILTSEENVSLNYTTICDSTCVELLGVDYNSLISNGCVDGGKNSGWTFYPNIIVQLNNTTKDLDILSSPIRINSGDTSSRTARNSIISEENGIVSSGDIIAINVDSITDIPPKGLIIEMVFSEDI